MPKAIAAKYTIMKISALKKHLANLEQITFVTPTGGLVPAHFHITEAGLTTKHFIDCGRTIRTEQYVSFQLWVANDIDHRLTADKLLNIIHQSEALWNHFDLEVEVEYQEETIGRYGLHFNGTQFVLTPKQTACLAEDACGIPQTNQKPKVNLANLTTSTGSCTPGSGCC